MWENGRARGVQRHLLVIAGVFPPAGGGGALRMVKLLKHLPTYGWQPHVVAPRARSGWFADPGLLEEIAGVEVTRTGLPVALFAESLRRRAKDPRAQSLRDGMLRRAIGAGRSVRNWLAIPDEHLVFAIAAVACAARLAQRSRFDLLATTSFPYSCHLAGIALQRLTGLPWLADFADPWAGHTLRVQDVNVRGRIDHALEAAVLRRASCITVASPGMERLLAARCDAAVVGKIRQLHNAYDTEDFAGATPRPADGRFELLFVGTFDARLSPPRPFVEGLRQLVARRPDITGSLRVRILGGADLASNEYLRQRLVGSAAEIVQFEGYATHTEAVRAMCRADGLLISVAPGAHWHLTAKVFEYLASGTPILAAVPDGDCRDLLERCGGAVIVQPQEYERIAATIERGIDEGTLRVPALHTDRVAELAAPRVAERAAALLDEIVARQGVGL